METTNVQNSVSARERAEQDKRTKRHDPSKRKTRQVGSHNTNRSRRPRLLFQGGSVSVT